MKLRYTNDIYGNELLKICFDGINIHKSIHICCGYPDKLEETDYLKFLSKRKRTQMLSGV